MLFFVLQTSSVYLNHQVTVEKANNLRDADWAPGGGSSDPYCAARHIFCQGWGLPELQDL